MMRMLQIVVLFLVIISQPGLCLENKSEYHDLASLLEYPASADDLEHIRSVLKHVSILYPEQKIRLNTIPIDADSINIIYFSSSHAPVNKTETYRNNCMYKHEVKAVICDQEFITKMIHYYDLHEERACSINRPDGMCWHEEEIVVPAATAKVKEYRRFFINWIMAHEIGHGYHGHEGQYFFAFSDNSPANDIALSQCQRNEIVADSFFSSVLEVMGESLDVRNNFEMLLRLERKRTRCHNNKSLVIDCDISVGPYIPLPSEPIDITSTEKHPHFMIRLLLSIGSIKVGDNTDALYGETIDKFLAYSINHNNNFIDTDADCVRSVQ